MGSQPDRTTTRAWTSLARAARTVTEAIEADLKAAGLPPLAWYDVLLELERTERRALRPFELEARLLLAQYNLSRLINRIAKAGYVRKKPVSGDARGHEVSLLPAGSEIRKRMWPVYGAAIERYLGDKLGPGQATVLAGLLGRLMPDGSVGD